MRIYRSRTIDIPQDLNLTELLHTSATGIPDSHLICKDSLTNRSITIGELRSRAGRIAHGLQINLQPDQGDRWAIILPNSVEFLEMFHAVLWVGGIGCPINHAMKAAEIGHALTVARPKYILAYGAVMEKILDAIDEAMKDYGPGMWNPPIVITVIDSVEGYQHLPDDFIQKTKLPIPHYSNPSQHLASIHFSSGTTGRPKGVELTHANYVANCYQLFAQDPKQFQPQCKTVVITPFVHIGMSTLALFFGPWTGMMHHAMPKYELEEFGKIVTSTRPTNFQGVASVALTFANTDITELYDFSQAQVINYGGPPLKDDMYQRLLSKASWKVIQVYGMTEVSPYVAYQKMNEELPIGTVGTILPNIEAALMKAGTKESAPEGGPGELWIRGPNITGGYAFSERATNEAFPMPGWFNTGDVCTISSKGLISIVGRTKELIKYKGFQVWPAELESHLNAHNFVIEAGVGSVWDEGNLTELPTAYVVLKPNFRTVEERLVALKEIHGHIDGQVSGYKKLRGGVWNIESLPLNATGKIDRNRLRDNLLGQCSLVENMEAPMRARL